MAEVKGKVVLIGKRWSGRTTLANMLVSGKLKAELKDCPVEPIDTNSICKTYVGRGWTVINTMGFGEPLGGIVPVEYARKMVIDFLNEVKGCYSHIIFVVNISDIQKFERGDKSTMSIIWKTFLEIFKGGEENFVLLVNEVPSKLMWPTHVRIEEMFPECKQFLYASFSKFPDVSKSSGVMIEEGIAERKQKLERLEMEMKEMFKASPWVEPDIFKMGDEEIKEIADIITHQITSIQVDIFRRWGTWHGWVDEQIVFYHYCVTPGATQVLKHTAIMVLRVRDNMENLGKKVKFYNRQCENLLQRSMGASKEVSDLLGGTGMNWYERPLEGLIRSLNRLVCCMEAGRELLLLCGDSRKEQEVALTLSSPGSGRNSFSKIALVLRDLEWSLDAFRFLFHNPEAEHATKCGRQSWLSKFLWCEARCRLVYAGDSENKVADADLDESCVAADNERQAQDQQDLISSMESHFSTSKEKPEKKLCNIQCFPIKEKKNKLFKSEILSYMSVLRNSLQGDSSFEGPSTVLGCFWIPGNQKYKLIEFIGAGSYKVVHKCEWLGMNVAVATFLDQGGASRTALEAEAGLLARVQHPNVVTFIGCTYDEEKQRGFLVTELMETSLRSLINKGNRRSSWSYPFTISESIDILLQIVEAVIHVHECGVIHRDLKAENFLVNRNRKHDHDQRGESLYVAEVKLIDFGTSKLQSTEMGSNFDTLNKGTRQWMAPEVIGKEGDEIKLYTWSADVYSFGITCYEIITGDVPFGRLMGRALPEMICGGHRPTIPDNCPDGLRELMTECWAHIPEDRPTFKDIRQRLWSLKLYYTIWNIT